MLIWCQRAVRNIDGELLDGRHAVVQKVHGIDPIDSTQVGDEVSRAEVPEKC